MIKLIAQFLIILLPWSFKRAILVRFWKYDLDSSARIGLSWIYPYHLCMRASSRIGHLTVAIHLEKMTLCEHSSIGRNNWITGFSKQNTRHFMHQTERAPELYLGKHAAVTKSHHFDCTESIVIGDYTTIAGYSSQFLTHSIDLAESRQHSGKISIGSYCFIGTNVVVLGGASLAKCCVLGAKSLLIDRVENPYTLVGGVPAKPIKKLDPSLKYFLRETGFVF